MSIRLGRGDGTFEAAPEVGVGGFPQSITVGDFNGDSRPDLATANSQSNTVSILLGRGDGTFEAAPEVGVGLQPVAITVGDFDGDGRLDLATANYNDLAIRLGRGDGTFQAAPEVEAGQGLSSITAGDFNGDGRLDLATASGIAATVSILLSRGDGRFQATPEVGVGTGPTELTVGDFNGDGHQDLATANASANSVSILLGRGDGTFEAAPEVGVGAYPWSITVGEFNSDGHQDLATANLSANTVSILLGQGNGMFFLATHEFEFGVGATPQAIAGGDFNGDGRQDLTTANAGDLFALGTVLILLNDTVGGVVNDLVSFDPIPSTFTFTPDPSGCPPGFVGIFRFEARLTNIGEPHLSDLVVAVTTLTDGNLLQNADGSPGGVGARLTVPRQEGFTDGRLTPDEFVDVPFLICLTERQPFQFVVDVLGETE